MYLSHKKMKKYILYIVFLFSVMVLLYQCKPKKSVTTNTATEIITFDKKSQLITINNSYKEPVKSVYLYDKQRELIKHIEDLPTNKAYTVNGKNVYIVHVFTFKTMHIKYINSGVK